MSHLFKFARGLILALLVPVALTAVWAVGSDNVIRMRLIKTGRVQGETVEVLSGLSDGDRVVTAGMEKAVDGAQLLQTQGGAQ